MQGVYWILSTMPTWAIAAILLTFVVIAVLVGREHIEGFHSELSFRTVRGDAGIVVVALIGSSVIQHGPVFMPTWLQFGLVHLSILLSVASVGVAFCLYKLRNGEESIVDIYRDVLVTPSLVTLSITLLPVVILNGNTIEKISGSVFVILWALFNGIDLWSRVKSSQAAGYYASPFFS